MIYHAIKTDASELKDDVFVTVDDRNDAIYELKIVEDKPPEIKVYKSPPGKPLPFYKEGVELDKLYGTTFLCGRLLGYHDDLTYIPRVIVTQYASRMIFDILYKHKYPLTPEEIKEELTCSVTDFRGRERRNSSPTYIARIANTIVMEQKECADLFAKKLSPASQPCRDRKV